MGYPHFRKPPNFVPFNGHAPLFKQTTLRTLVKAGTSSVPTNWLGEAGIARWRLKLPLEAANTQGRLQRQKHAGNQSLSCWALLNSEHYCGHGTQPDLLVQRRPSALWRQTSCKTCAIEMFDQFINRMFAPRSVGLEQLHCSGACILSGLATWNPWIISWKAGSCIWSYEKKHGSQSQPAVFHCWRIAG